MSTVSYKIDCATLSENEQIIGKWVDGSTLYRKVYVINDPVLNTTTNYSHGISNLGGIRYIQDMFVIRGGTNSRSVNYMYSTSAYSVAQIDDTKITYRLPFSEWMWDDTKSSVLYVIVCYTKTN